MKQMNPAAGRALVAAFELRTGRVMEFCETQGVSYATLKYWRTRIAELDAQDGEADTTQPLSSFVQVTASSVATSTAAVVVILPNQVRFIFQHSCDVHTALVEALAQC